MAKGRVTIPTAPSPAFSCWTVCSAGPGMTRPSCRWTVCMPRQPGRAKCTHARWHTVLLTSVTADLAVRNPRPFPTGLPPVRAMCRRRSWATVCCSGRWPIRIASRSWKKYSMRCAGATRRWRRGNRVDVLPVASGVTALWSAEPVMAWRTSMCCCAAAITPARTRMPTVAASCWRRMASCWQPMPGARMRPRYPRLHGISYANPGT